MQPANFIQGLTLPQSKVAAIHSQTRTTQTTSAAIISQTRLNPPHNPYLQPSIHKPGLIVLRGGNNWEGLIPTKEDPYLDGKLKKEITLYGEAAELTYDSVDLRSWSRYRDQNRFPKEDLFGKHLKDEFHFAELPEEGYSASAYMYASEKGQITKSLMKKGQKLEEHVWIGYVAYSEQRKDILVAWRGTQKPAEWIADGMLDQIPYVSYKSPSDPPSSNKASQTHDSSDSSPPAEKTQRSFRQKLIDFLRAAPKWAISTITKLTPPLVAFLWASPLLVKWAPKYFPAWTASSVASLERQIRDPSSGFLAKAGAALWAGSLLAFPKLKYFYIAAASATFWGVGFAAIPGALLYALSRIPSFQASGLLSLILTLPPSFLAAIPTLELIGVRDKVGYKLYTALAGAFSIWASVNSPGDFVATISPVAWFVFLPLAITAGEAAWAGAGKGPMVHEGFFELYRKPPSEGGGARGDEEKMAPRVTLHAAVKALLERALHDKDKAVETISVTGHSLGAGLAVLSSFDLVKSGTSGAVPVTCYSFEGPRVGNIAFAEDFDRQESLSAIRVVNKPDVVTQVPKALFLQNVYYMLGAVLNFDWASDVVNVAERLTYKLRLPSAYKHVGSEVTMDSRQVDYIQQMEGHNPLSNEKQIHTYHNLECALHVLSGFSETPKPFGASFDRDFALVNKIGDALKLEFGISPSWLDTLTPNVEKAKRGSALIQPYEKKEEPPSGGDNHRQVGQGPGEVSGALHKDYLKEGPKECKS